MGVRLLPPLEHYINCKNFHYITLVAYPARLKFIQDGGIIYAWRKIYSRWRDNLCVDVIK